MIQSWIAAVANFRLMLSSLTELAMGLDITAYSQITLLEIVSDEETWQQRYGDADENGDALDPDPPLVFLSADLPFADRLAPLTVPSSGIAVYQGTGDAFAFRAGPYSYYNQWREQLSLLMTGLPPKRLWTAGDLAETQLPPVLLIDRLFGL